MTCSWVFAFKVFFIFPSSRCCIKISRGAASHRAVQIGSRQLLPSLVQAVSAPGWQQVHDPNLLPQRTVMCFCKPKWGKSVLLFQFRMTQNPHYAWLKAVFKRKRQVEHLLQVFHNGPLGELASLLEGNFELLSTLQRSSKYQRNMDKPSRRAECQQKQHHSTSSLITSISPVCLWWQGLGVGLAWSSLAIPSAIGQLDVIAEVHVPVSAAGSIMNVHDGYWCPEKFHLQIPFNYIYIDRLCFISFHILLHWRNKHLLHKVERTNREWKNCSGSNRYYSWGAQADEGRIASSRQSIWHPQWGHQ